MSKLKHICEVCDRTEIVEPSEAHEAGWDYPPLMGAFGILSARTCPNCPITDTVWWALAVDKVSPEDLTEKQLAVIARVQSEPESILP